ncbi:hypothetical protein BDR03DRAFT_1016765 [Suillus americanus]|nr:hypothetical protein BDR03DRAFT_1016765 [Suillus americanus]
MPYETVAQCDRTFGLLQKLSILSVVKCDPAWLSASPMCYEGNLNCLTVSVLRDAAQRIGCKRSEARLKANSFLSILRHFDVLRTELASPSDEVPTWRFSMHLPITSLQTCVTLIAAAVHIAYGSDAAAALRRSPVFSLSDSDFSTLRYT